MAKVISVKINFVVTDNYRPIEEIRSQVFDHFNKVSQGLPDCSFCTLSVRDTEGLKDPWQEVIEKYSPDRPLF